MGSTSRELVWQTLRREQPARAPRQLWVLPWAEQRHPDALAAIQRDFPDDIVGAPAFLPKDPRTQGDMHRVGTYLDPWGAIFKNVQEGVIGEVKAPLIRSSEADVGQVHVPVEWLECDLKQINRFCAATDRFVHAGCCPRPFEQLQFLRGTAELYLDLLAPPPQMLAFLKRMHDFHCELLERWARTDIDALFFMDDWGAQSSLLISPALWRELFKPLYRDYIEIAHAAGKAAFMHSDGYILDIYPDLIELGLDAVNSQIFCMGVEALAPFAGRITFWGEIDRQHLLPWGSEAEIDAAVAKVGETLWREGGCIAQCEFGAGAKPENVGQVFASWDQIHL